MAASLEYVDTSFKPILLFSWRTRDVIEKEKYETITVAFHDVIFSLVHHL